MGNLFDPNNPNTWPQNYKQRPTEAFTNVGQTPRDLAQSQVKNRFASNAQTPVHNAGGRLSMAGMQTPYENFNLAPGNVAQAASIAMAPGIAKDIFNGTYLFGKTVVHGSPQQGLKEIVPRTGSGRFPEDSIVYGWNPTWNNRYPGQGPGWTVDAATGYTGYENTGSIYIGKIPRKDILIDPDESMSHMVLGSKPIRVVKEFEQSGKESPGFDYHNQTYLPIQGRTETEGIKEAMVKALRRNGVGVMPENKIGPFIDKNMDKIKEMLYKRLNKIPEDIA